MLKALQHSPLSALGLLTGAQAPAEGATVLTERPRMAVVNLRVAPNSTKAKAAVKQIVADGLAGAVSWTGDDAGRCIWLGPDEWLITSLAQSAEAIIATLSAELGNVHHSLVDLSSNYTTLRLTGPDAVAVMARMTPLDLHPSVCRAGAAAGTNAGKANINLLKIDDAPTFDLMVRRSFAQYVRDYTLDAGRSSGIVFGGAEG